MATIPPTSPVKIMMKIKTAHHQPELVPGNNSRNFTPFLLRRAPKLHVCPLLIKNLLKAS
jgi:hypothetical protein